MVDMKITESERKGWEAALRLHNGPPPTVASELRRCAPVCGLMTIYLFVLSALCLLADSQIGAAFFAGMAVATVLHSLRNAIGSVKAWRVTDYVIRWDLVSELVNRTNVAAGNVEKV